MSLVFIGGGPPPSIIPLFRMSSRMFRAASAGPMFILVSSRPRGVNTLGTTLNTVIGEGNVCGNDQITVRTSFSNVFIGFVKTLRNDFHFDVRTSRKIDPSIGDKSRGEVVFENRL